jgi:hypothetical protein
MDTARELIRMRMRPQLSANHVFDYSRFLNVEGNENPLD